MQVVLIPQKSENLLEYSIHDGVVEARLRIYLGNNVDNEPMYYNQSDVFDFTSTLDGKLAGVETELPICPILSAIVREGNLIIELMHFVPENATVGEMVPKVFKLK